MRLTKFSDYAMRMLIYSATSEEDLVRIEQVAAAFGISQAHLMKVTNALTRAGFLEAVRGRAGGLRLAVAPENILLGDVLRVTEPDFAVVECLQESGNSCPITGCCKLSRILHQATMDFLQTLDRYTLADIVLSKDEFTEFL